MAPSVSLNKGKLYIDTFSHGVSGLGAWKQMADGMLAAVSRVRTIGPRNGGARK